MEDLRKQLDAQLALIEQLQGQLLTQSQSANANFLPGMATPPPQQFNFKSCDWPNWITRFEQYRETTKLKLLPSETQVNSLLYTMGGQANNILTSMKLSPEQMKSYEIVRDKFDAYYTARKTKMYSRARFNQRVQKDDESVDEFITELHTLAKKCEFGHLEDELIRDRIVAGMKNVELSKAIQNLEEEPKLENVINRVRHAETVDANIATLKRDSPAPEVHFVHKKTAKKPIKQYATDGSCRKCGRTPKHKFSECEAAKSTCNSCGIKGHWKAVCKKKEDSKDKRVNEIENEIFFGSIESRSNTIHSINTPKISPCRSKCATISVNGQKIKFKIDTGASQTVLSPQLRTMLKLSKPIDGSEKLIGPCGIILPGQGVCKNVRLTWQGKTILTDVYILEGQHTPLLGLAECEAFGVVKWHKEAQIMQLQTSTNTRPEDEFKQIFKGLGTMAGEYQIKLKEGATPYSVTTPRHISIPIRPKVEKTLQTLQDMGVIEPVSRATEWCAPMVPVPDKNDTDKVRITVDYTELNKAVMREYHPLPTVEECLAQLSGSKIFSKIDAVKSYFQVKLTEDCKDLTTFITPFGRFQFNRMPMGMNSSSEVFQRKMAILLAGIKGCVNHIDDTLVHGRTVEEHDANLRKVLKALSDGGVTLNQKKCIFRTSECTFLGYKVSSDGIEPLQDKIKAIIELPIPKDLTALRSFMGAVNQHLRFLQNTSDVTKPLRDLLKKDSSREWNEEHTKAFQQIKKLLTSAPQLAHYDPNLETRVSADASQYGMGAVLEQKHGDLFKPVHFWSSAFTPTQQRYAMIEKEACATTMACERFKLYLVGLQTFTIRTDHKPLISILGSKPIADLPTRLQRFRMRMTPFNYKIEHVPGKYMYTADMLSRAPLSTQDKDRDILDKEEKLEETTFLTIIKEMPFSDERLHKIKEAQKDDSLCRKIHNCIMNGWPKHKNCDEDLKPFLKQKDNLILLNDIIACEKRLYIPAIMRQEIFTKLHTGHVTSFKAQLRARLAVWWPNLEDDINQWTKKCEVCAKLAIQRPEPLISGEVPKYPFEIIAADLCTYKGKEYLVVRDVLSNYPEVISLTSTTSIAIINHLKSIMARHGIPRVLRTDNGPQFSSKQFEEFTRKWDFTHITSSPHFPQSNGAAEIGVKIIKKIFERNPEDPLLGLLHYRTTPTQLGPAPAQIAMSRLLNSTIPITATALKPKTQDLDLYREKLMLRREKAKESYDKRHNSKELPGLDIGRKVFLPDEKLYGTVIVKRKEPRSYIIATEKGGELRKNRKAIIEMPVHTKQDSLLMDVPASESNTPTTSENLQTYTPNYNTEDETLHVSQPLDVTSTNDTETNLQIYTPNYDTEESMPSPSSPTEETLVSTPTDLTPYVTPASSTTTSVESSPEKIITTRSGRQVKLKQKCSCKDCF